MSKSSEDVIGQKYDRCVADLLVKAGVGFGAGVVASVILFRRLSFPSSRATILEFLNNLPIQDEVGQWRSQQASAQVPPTQIAIALSTPPESQGLVYSRP